MKKDADIQMRKMRVHREHGAVQLLDKTPGIAGLMLRMRSEYREMAWQISQRKRRRDGGRAPRFLVYPRGVQTVQREIQRKGGTKMRSFNLIGAVIILANIFWMAWKEAVNPVSGLLIIFGAMLCVLATAFWNVGRDDDLERQEYEKKKERQERTEYERLKEKFKEREET